MKTWQVDAVAALESWTQADAQVQLEVSQWLRTMRQWGPPPSTPWKAGSDVLMARHAPTNTLMMFRLRTYGDEHLYAGSIRVLRFIEPHL